MANESNYPHLHEAVSLAIHAGGVYAKCPGMCLIRPQDFRPETLVY